MSKETSSHEFQDPRGLGTVTFAEIASAESGIANGGTIAGSGTLTSNLILTDGHRYLTFAVQSTQAGVASIQRYVDSQGSIAQGGATTIALTGGTLGVVNVTDLLPAQSFKAAVTNTATATATLSNTMLLVTGG